MKKRIVSLGFILAFVLTAFLVTPSQSFARDSFEEFTQYEDKKNKFLSMGCRPKIEWVCETIASE